ncbi:DUF2971 domain-containing protein [Kordiimonas laminariae]|uniref:DUF2971 domain-containing protein n=1 Tax=Kordiimonas laminariae TaxID=2917717 RepID=UPI001FF23B7A|nr:DUF2971 domain-containing protein [Kordiimonas laminariae]MCK0068211.1 DUF2971 domain-containing protein [Kordiimonas laminariae]
MTIDQELFKQKAYDVFFPKYKSKLPFFEKNEVKLAHYTSAGTAYEIIKNEEIWLRNTNYMNDHDEVNHGLKCLHNILSSTEVLNFFKDTLNSISPGIFNETTQRFDRMAPYLNQETYISCFSEHDPVSENDLGRLSMWRAYGGNSGVSIIFNTGPFFSESNSTKALSFLVDYEKTSSLKGHLLQTLHRLQEEREYFSSIPKERLIDTILMYLLSFPLAIKHPGFQEEKELRIVYNPAVLVSDKLIADTVTLDDIPQKIYKIPLKDYPEEGFIGATPKDIINRIIIGPSHHATSLKKTFIELLQNKGVENAETKVVCSDIPLRT